MLNSIKSNALYYSFDANTNLTNLDKNKSIKLLAVSFKYLVSK